MGENTHGREVPEYMAGEELRDLENHAGFEPNHRIDFSDNLQETPMFDVETRGFRCRF